MLDLISILKRNAIDSAIGRVIFGISLMFLASQVTIPLKPVPVTLQTAAVLILALCYNKKDAMRSIIGFVALGALGAPVFVNLQSGIFRPTGGYALGMILCIYVITTLRERFGEDGVAKLALYSIIGSVCVYLLGLPWLAFFVGSENAIKFGLLPFILPGVVKAMFVAASVNLIRRNL